MNIYGKNQTGIILTLSQELEALRSQVQSQSAEINQMKTERQELLRRAEAGVYIMQIWHFVPNIYHIILNRHWIIESSSGFCQSSDAVPSSDSSLDATKMTELESRLAAQTTETEKLKVCKITVQQNVYMMSVISEATLHPFLQICSVLDSSLFSIRFEEFFLKFSRLFSSSACWFRRKQRARRRAGWSWSSSWPQPPARWPSCRRRKQSCKRRCKSPRRSRMTCWCCWQTRTRKSTASKRNSKTWERR